MNLVINERYCQTSPSSTYYYTAVVVTQTGTVRNVFIQ